MTNGTPIPDINRDWYPAFIGQSEGGHDQRQRWTGWREWTGYPDHAQPIARAHDQDVQQALWDRSEQLTGVTYQLTAAAQ